jgi:hypothetical protein
MHAATLKNSSRLQAVHSLLLDGQEHSTRDIIKRTGMCAINSIISELRENKIRIDCRYVGETENGNSEYAYKLSGPASGAVIDGSVGPCTKQGDNVVPRAGAGLSWRQHDVPCPACGKSYHEVEGRCTRCATVEAWA